MSERYQREIEDLLGSIEGVSVRVPKPKRRGLTRRLFSALGRSLGGRVWSFSPERIMLTGGILLLVALLFKASLPGFVVPILLWTAVIVFILGYALVFVNTSDTYEMRWRGRPVERPPNWRDRMRRWGRTR